HRRADEAHRTHADAVAEVLQLLFEHRDLRVGIGVADCAQTRRLFAQHHGRVLAAAEAYADDRRLAREAAPAELHHHVEKKLLDAVDAVAWEEHAVIRPEQAALVHRGDVDPVGVRLERVLDLRRVDADIVVVVLARERADPVRAERHVACRAGRGAAERTLEPDEAAVEPRLVSDLYVVAWHAGVGAHGAAVLL